MTRLRVVALLVACSLAVGLWTIWPTRQVGLVIYSSVGGAAVMARAFSDETGIPVTVIPLSAGPLLARISAEARHPRWSLAWFEGDGAASALDQGGLLARHLTPVLPWTEAGRMLQPADGAWTTTGFTLAGTFVYRANAAATSTNTWTGLIAQAARPEHRLRLGLADPALSGPAYPLLAGLLMEGGGWPGGQALVRRLQADDPRVLPSNPSVIQALRSWQVDVAIVQSSAAYALFAGDSRYRVSLPRPAVVLPTVAAIAAGATPRQRQYATRFVRFVMQPRIQALHMSLPSADRLYWPVTSDIDQPNLPPAATIDMLHPDPALWGSRQAEVTDWFEREIVGR